MNCHNSDKKKIIKKPQWLKIKLPTVQDYSYLKTYLKRNNIHTICESGKCPNIAECWSARTATFMILGNRCTRNCMFCAVDKSSPLPVDENEPEKIANAVNWMKIKHCVITSVTRDDLPNGGSYIWNRTIRAIKHKNPHTTIEALIPDFNNKTEHIYEVLSAHADIVAHNLETVKRLTPKIRIKASYSNSLNVLKIISDYGIKSKSGLMVGLGETFDEILETMDDLISVNCKIISIGQYLQPRKSLHPVLKYYLPEEFELLKNIAIKKGFLHAECGPLVRSSYHAHNQISTITLTENY